VLTTAKPETFISGKKGTICMCLAIPSKIVKIENGLGTIDVDGVQRSASLILVEDAAVGDYVIVHAGFALHKIDEADAMESLRILKEAAEFVEKREYEP
jgi:hydrogenase expression/formation protein HypC